MERASLALVGCLVSMLGCFPDPPAVGEVQDGAGDSAEGEADATGEDAAVETEVAVDSSVADTVDQEVEVSADTSIEDTAGEAEVSVDTSIADTAGEVEVSVDAEVVDTADEEAEVSVDTSIADTASEVVEPECEGDEGCSHLVGVCRAGVCQGGVCVEEALTGESCDDGDLCTEGDVCDGGACVGVAVVCEALDDCHDAGECDSRTGECSDVPLSGIGCDDGDACTTGDGCAEGVCAGEAVVCVAKDQCHDAGVCDPQSGQCTEPRKPDTTPCDDGMLCTEEDRCEAGGCVGVEVVCEANGECELTGSCDASTGECTRLTKPEGTTCVDDDPCTPSSSCQSGLCTGTGVPTDANGDWALSLSTGDDAFVLGMTQTRTSELWALASARGSTLTLKDHDGGETRHDLPVGATEAIVLIDLTPWWFPGPMNIAWTDAPPKEFLLTSTGGFAELIDGSLAMALTFLVPFETMDGRQLGVSPNGFEVKGGVTVIRTSKDGEVRNATQYLNAGADQALRISTLTPLSDGSWVVSLPVRSGVLLEVVDDGGGSEVVALHPERGDRVLTVVERRTIAGQLVWRLLLDPETGTEGFGFSSVRSIREDGAALLVAGWASHATATFLGGVPALRIPGDLGEAGAFGIHIDATGGLPASDYFHFYPDDSRGSVLPISLRRSGEGYSAMFFSTGRFFMRTPTTANPVVVSQLGPDSYGYPSGVVAVSSSFTNQSASLRDLVAGSLEAVGAVSEAQEHTSWVGLGISAVEPDGEIVETEDPSLRSHFLRIRQGESSVLLNLLEYLAVPSANAAQVRIAPPVHVISGSGGGTWIGGYVRAPVIVGIHNRITISPAEDDYAGYIAHLNSENGLVCE